MRPFWSCLGLVILIVVGTRAALRRRRRLRAWRDLARKRRFNFSPGDPIGLHERYQNLDMIRQGHRRHACNVLHGPTPDGSVSVFSYSYELGFGMNRSDSSWWFAVVESAGAVHQHWRAIPGDRTDRSDSPSLDRFQLLADHERTREQLLDAGIERVFQDAPANYNWEVRGPLIAVATPFDAQPETPDRLLTTATNLARSLAGLPA